MHGAFLQGVVMSHAMLGRGVGSRARLIREWFDVGARSGSKEARSRVRLPEVGAGRVVLIAGPTGAGKSTLLRRYRRGLAHGRVIDLARMRLPERAVIELFPSMSIEGALAGLSRVGLAEAHTYLLPPSKLSDGQRWRLRLAVAVARCEASPRKTFTIVADEFAALLDRVTAWIVARAVRKAVDRVGNLGAVVATSHEDVEGPLGADVVVRCDFGEVRVEPRMNADERG